MSLVAQYKLDEKTGTAIADFVGTNPGTSANTVVPIAGPGNETGLVFNGTDDVIAVGANSVIDANGKTALTITAWINPASDGGGNAARMLDKGYYFYITNESSGVVHLRFSLIMAGADVGSVKNGGVTLNKWSHVAAVYNEDGNKKGKLYIDGFLQSLDVDIAGVDAVSDDSADDLRIGNTDVGSSGFDGSISDVRIYDEALSQNRIVQIMNESLYDRTLRNRNRR